MHSQSFVSDLTGPCRQAAHIPFFRERSGLALPTGGAHPIMCAEQASRLVMSNDPQNPNDKRPKWRGRTEVLLLVAGGLILLIPTLAIFLAG